MCRTQRVKRFRLILFRKVKFGTVRLLPTWQFSCQFFLHYLPVEAFILFFVCLFTCLFTGDLFGRSDLALFMSEF